ncbi:MAG: hypothetical protein AAF570_08920, partial [Bacteroidota bacterium]
RKVICEGTPDGQPVDYIGTLTARWLQLADLYLAAPDTFRLVVYEDFLKDKAGAIHALAADLGLEVKHDIRAKVDVQYERKGNRNVDWQTYFGPDNLARINQLCGTQMTALGYDPKAISPK